MWKQIISWNIGNREILFLFSCDLISFDRVKRLYLRRSLLDAVLVGFPRKD